jgi:hypothetical protein
MGAAPGIQLGIGPESADTLKPPWSALRALRVGCLHLREISQPQVIQYGCTHRTPATCGPSISPTCVSISGWLATATSDAGCGVLPYVAPAAVRGRRADISDVQRDLYPVDSLLQTLRPISSHLGHSSAQCN